MQGGQANNRDVSHYHDNILHKYPVIHWEKQNTELDISSPDPIKNSQILSILALLSSIPLFATHPAGAVRTSGQWEKLGSRRQKRSSVSPSWQSL